GLVPAAFSLGYQPFSVWPRLFGGERNGVDVAPIIGFAAMGGAAVAEKPRRIRVGAGIEVFDMRQAGAPQPRRDVAREVEQGVPGTGRGREEWTGLAILGGKAFDQIGPDLIVGLTDHRSQRNPDFFARCPEPLHGGDRGFDNAGERAAPARMGGADDARLRLGKQNGTAIGRRYADGERGDARDDAVR